MGQNNQTLSKGFSCVLEAGINFASICLAMLIMNNTMPVGGTAIVVAVAISLVSVIVYFIFDMYTSKLLLRLHKVLLKLFVADLLILGIGIILISLFSKMNEFFYTSLVATGISFILVSINTL